MEYNSLYQFTDLGMKRFEAYSQGRLAEAQISPTDLAVAVPVDSTNRFTAESYKTSKEMASAITIALGDVGLSEVISNAGLWAWLTFILRDTLFKKSGGEYKFGAYEVWMPSDPGDYYKAQRHKVRMPVQLYQQFGDDADHALCGRPDTPGDVRENTTAQQDMFLPEFQKLCKKLYFDPATRKIKRGAGGRGAGSPTRLAKVVRQLEVTWDIQSFSVDDWLDKLPPEFDRFRPQS